MKTILLAPVLLFGLAEAALARADVDFATQIRPIFEKSCYGCHGEEKQKGGLRLNSKAAAFKGGDDGLVLVANEPGKSDLYRRIILPAHSDDVMPPKGDPLTKEQTDLIHDWIKQGAMWPESADMKSSAPKEEAFEIVPGKPRIAPPPEVQLPADFKPSPMEAKATNALQTMGVEVWPIASGSPWHEANLRGQGDKNVDAALGQLKNVTSLVDLNLSGTTFSSTGFADLKSLTNLTQLHLEHTKVQDAELEVVNALPNLSYLNLYDTPVTDAGLDHLKNLQHLYHLHLWQTKVTTNAVENLQKALPHCEIDLGWVQPPAPPADTNKPPEKKDK